MSHFVQEIGRKNRIWSVPVVLAPKLKDETIVFLRASNPQKNLQFISPPIEAGDFLQDCLKWQKTVLKASIREPQVRFFSILSQETKRRLSMLRALRSAVCAFYHSPVAAPNLPLPKNCEEISCFFAVLALTF